MCNSIVEPANPRHNDVPNNIDMWAIADLYLDNIGVARQNIVSYENFLYHDINVINSETLPMVASCHDSSHKWNNTRHTLKITNYSFGPTQIQEGGSKSMLRKTAQRGGNVGSGDDASDVTVALPSTCRVRKANYCMKMYFDYEHTVDCLDPATKNVLSSNTKIIKSRYVGDVPVLVMSKPCAIMSALACGKTLEEIGEDTNENGGYFIVNGVERSLVTQMLMRPSFPFVSKSKDEPGAVQCEIRSSDEKHYKLVNPTTVLYKQYNKKEPMTFKVSIPYQKRNKSPSQDIPLPVLMRALGISTDKEIIRLCVHDFENSGMVNMLKTTMEQSVEVNDTESALLYVGKRFSALDSTREQKLAVAKTLLNEDLLPHIGTTADMHNRKAFFIGYCVKKMMHVSMGKRPEDDKDDYGNKRACGTGSLMAGLYSQLLRKCRSDGQKVLEKTVQEGGDIDYDSLIRHNTITTGFIFSIATGNWVANKSPGGKTGVSSALVRLGPGSSLSQLTKTNTPIERAGKMSGPRELNPTHVGIIDPYQTPEGASVGLNNYYGLLTYISLGEPSCIVADILRANELFVSVDRCSAGGDMRHMPKPLSYTVLVNGSIVGFTDNAPALRAKMEQLRSTGTISPEISISLKYHFRELNFNTDKNRCMQPLIPVTNNVPALTKSDLLNIKYRTNGKETVMSLIAKGKLVLVDTEESMPLCICSDIEKFKDPENFHVHQNGVHGEVRYTHCLIHPSLALGICSSSIPFSNHNPSARNIYQCSMSQAAISMPLSSHANRMDTISHYLAYGQAPLVQTATMKFTKYADVPSGVNAIVMVLAHDYNQEDAVVLNKGSIERGLFLSVATKSYSEEEKRVGDLYTEQIAIGARETTLKMKPIGAYKKLDDDGIVHVGARVTTGDVLIAKISPIYSNMAEDSKAAKGVTYTHVDKSLVYKHNQHGVIESVSITDNQEGNRLVTVKVRIMKIPVIGDKFSSRHGQKGVCGMIVPEEDMPRTGNGMAADLLINPHALPGRMTVGHIIETVAAKTMALSGIPTNGTPYEEDSVHTIGERLVALGYQNRGNERVYCGMTGVLMEAEIYVGPIYYQRLKHMANDKIHARTTGPVNIRTRQPVEGRSNGGGMKIGEMEKDCLISHGAAMTLKSRLMDNSDAFRIYVCQNCGDIGYHDPLRNLYKCPRSCSGNKQGTVFPVEIPYASKLLFQELAAMNISCRMEL